MLFGKRRRTLEELNGKANVLRKEIQLLREETQKNASATAKTSQLPVQTEALEEAIKKVEKQITRQSASFEDLLDELQEHQARQDADVQRQREWEKKEQALLSWAVLERDQLRLLRDALLDAPSLTEEAKSAWKAQFAIMEADRTAAMAQCGIQETGTPGERFDPGVHEILQIQDAPEKDLDGTLAQLYSPSLFYCGKLLQKAKVAVYRWKEKEPEPAAPEAGGESA